MINAILIFFSNLIFINFCDPISENELKLLINSYQNNVEKKYEEVSELLNNGTVSKFNVPFRVKLYTLKLDKIKMERNIEKLNNQNTNDNKYSEEYYRNEKAFLKGYRHLLNILKGTNNFYLKTIRTIKRIFFAFILVIFFGGIIALLIMLYISNIRISFSDESIEASLLTVAFSSYSLFIVISRAISASAASKASSA